MAVRKPDTLTDAEEAFAVEFVRTGDRTEAYRSAYSPRAGLHPRVMLRMACRVLNRPRVARRVAELRLPVIAAAACGLDEHLTMLARLRDAAIADRNWHAAIRAEIARGHASGHYNKAGDAPLGEQAFALIYLPAKAQSSREWLQEFRPDLPVLPSPPATKQ